MSRETDRQTKKQTNLQSEFIPKLSKTNKHKEMTESLKYITITIIQQGKTTLHPLNVNVKIGKKKAKITIYIL